LLLTCFHFPLSAQTPPPTPVQTSITVVETISTETPADVSSLDAAQLQQTPGVDLDDRLRSVPGFSLFRRSSSVVANPTTQGVSLRGLGSSGASRALVLWDGIPVNDPFGGWVYWTRFIPEEMARVEIAGGAPTSVFGDRAMSGVIGLFTRPPEPLHLSAAFEAGNRDSRDASLGFSQVWRGLAVSGDARAYSTGGYYIVPSSIRGPVDQPASVRFVAGNVHIDQRTSFGDFFLAADALAEDRRNGTTLTHNSTGLGTASLRYERQFARDSISLLGYHSREGFHSSFSSIGAGRGTERLTYLQTVPSQGSGGAAVWQRHQQRWNLTAGGDVDRVSGASTDHLVPTGLRVGGGSQLQHGLFTQADATLGAFRLFGGLRHSFTGQGGKFLSPSAGASFAQKRLRLRASVYRAFRAPTLNELYREFRVGNTDTLANPNLRPETLSGAEAGADWVGEASTFRVTAYRNSLDNLIANVTLSSAANSIVRQRQNAAAAVSRGVEAEFERRFRDWRADFQYLFADSRYATGYRIAQIPKHQGSAQAVYQHGGAMASLGVRSYAYQFDDDLNQFRLPGYAVVELAARRHLAASLSAEAAIDNALNHDFYIAFTPTPNIGQPRLWRIGLRWEGKL
jgi:outer membrane cobalamin receptor